jgi:hypothetical protein
MLLLIFHQLDDAAASSAVRYYCGKDGMGRLFYAHF